MTSEARLAFVLFFFACWCFLGLLAWAVAAVVARGRGALPALPLAFAAASAAGVAMPLLGGRDFTGLMLSFLTATIGGALGAAGGIVLARRVWPEPPAGRRSARGSARVIEPEGSRVTPDT